MLKKVFIYLFIFTGTFLLVNCAKMGSITGGLKDEDPPKVVGSAPLNYSTKFTGKRIDITFDEFISLNNVNQSLVTSPPLSGKPDVRLKGKTVQVILEGDLRENTTYTLNFGNSIEDNNERNILENFEFVFSTGEFLDSLSIEGTIFNAFDLKPSEEPFVIMAYDILEDSIPLKEMPVYIGRSDKEGKYRINNMKADTFKIFAIKDLNYNYIFDLPNELIAFSDSLVFLFPDSLEKYEPPLLKEDTLIVEGVVTITTDSIELSENEPWFKPYRVDLLFFEEDRSEQYLTDYDRKEDRHLFFTFNQPVKDSFIKKAVQVDGDNWFIQEPNITNDTFNIWIKDSTVYQMDTLTVLIHFPGVDSMSNTIIKEDTLDMVYRKPPATRGKDTEVAKPVFNLKTIGNNNRLDLNRRIPFEAGNPLKETDMTKIFLYHIPDSVEFPAEYVYSEDSLSTRIFYLNSKWVSKGKYRLFLEPGALEDIYGIKNDTVNINFTIQDEEYYGVLFATTSKVTGPVIVQLMNEKELVLEERYIESDEKVTFPFLKPGKYIVKYIYDSNGNRKWDTGDYLRKNQPENVEYYKGEINIRSNWELEIKWELNDTD